MSQECHRSCCSQSSCHHSQGNSQSGCTCPCHQCGCHQHQERYADQLLKLADEAWMEVLKEKIKEEIRQHSGEHLAQTAKLVTSANHARWKDKFQGKRDGEEFEERLHDLLFSTGPKRS